MMRRDLLALIATVAAWPHGTQAQQPKKMPRLCFLTFDRVDPNTVQSSPRGPFFDALRDLGYVNGQTIIIDFLSAGGSSERFSAVVADCLRLGADILVATTTPAALAAKKATQSVPIVMYTLGDPVGTGLVDSLARPGGNVTGTTLMATGIAAKRLELLKEAVPTMARVLILSYGVDPITPLQLTELERAADTLEVKLLIQDIQKADDIPAAFDAGTRNGAEGLLTTASTIFGAERNRIAELAAHHRFPSMYPYRVIVDAGGLMSYEPTGLREITASFVDRILRGVKPSDLPVQQPTKFQLVINLKTANALGLTVPQSLLQRADEVIE